MFTPLNITELLCIYIDIQNATKYNVQNWSLGPLVDFADGDHKSAKTTYPIDTCRDLLGAP